ncbi:MAG: metal-sensing transcriptional repressor [Dehalococcoidia bacterium]|nr:metal-sensing transcriptional repressor [Dehalococcoidia bacterium]
MRAENKAEAIKRLRYAEGHLAAVQRMVEQDKYCVDILKQLFAVRKSLERVETVLLQGHLQSCVVEGIRGGKEGQVLQELVDLYGVARK